MKEALGLVRKFYSDDDDENYEKMSQKEFNTKAEVLMKGTHNLWVTFLFNNILSIYFHENILSIYFQFCDTIRGNTRIVYYNNIISFYFSIHEKSTLSVKHFKKLVASNMAKNSARRCHTLTVEQALTALDAVDFIHAKTCAKCGHRVIPASLVGLDQLTRQRPDPNLGYDKQVILRYCLGCQHLCMKRTTGQEARLHALIRLGYASHQPTHIGPRS